MYKQLKFLISQLSLLFFLLTALTSCAQSLQTDKMTVNTAIPMQPSDFSLENAIYLDSVKDLVPSKANWASKVDIKLFNDALKDSLKLQSLFQYKKTTHVIY